MFNKINIFLFSILPISLIAGNLLINFNIILINLSLLYFASKIMIGVGQKIDFFSKY